MQTFLEKTVDYLLEKYKDKTSDLCIVFPNRRAALFFKMHLTKKLSKVIWAPEIFSTEDFIARLNQTEMLDSVSLLFELYEIYIEINTEQEQESFEEFSKWAGILLHDFNEIDSYLIDVRKLYGNLTDIKEIENWSLNLDNLTEFQQKYLNFWDSLGVFYQCLTNELSSKNQSYQGLAYRMVAENIEEKIKTQAWHKVIFIGFNALNKAEKKIIDTLVKLEKAEVLWDTDVYYTKNKQQEAGKFIRQHKEQNISRGEEKFLWEEDFLSKDAKKITIIGLAKNVGQVKVAGDIIAKLNLENEDLQNTAVVLADENLLFPLLHSLPPEISGINVTMGYPLKNTPVANLFEMLFNLHENVKKFKKVNGQFYYKDIINFLRHPFLNFLFSGKDETPIGKEIINIIQKKNIVFVSLENIEKELGTGHSADLDILKPIFQTWEKPEHALAGIYYLIDLLKEPLTFKNKANKNSENQKNTEVNNSNIELEYLFAYAKIIKRIKTLSTRYNFITEIKTLRGLISQIVNTTTLPFYGEPLTGLQVMGMLETRTLDFENIILLSANENILPSGKSQNSFVPHDLKKIFGLPTYNDKDAIFAYHFYRLIQRAKNIFLIYNTEPDTFGNGEKSRFITQLMYELPGVNKNVIIEEKLLNLSIDEEMTEKPIIIAKTQEILEKIRAKGKDGYSPSLLNIYRNCSLQFYFHLIAGLKEIEEVQENIGADVLGTVIHEVLHDLYVPFKSKKIASADIRQMKLQAPTLVESAFGKEYPGNELKYGKNLLILKVAIRFILNFLNKEIISIEENEVLGKPTVIKGLEEELSIDIDMNGQIVRLKGTADRIDSVGNLTRIIDYKTGIVEGKELNVKQWESIQSESTLNKGFQLLMYALIYQRQSNDRNPLHSGIISFRELSAGLKTARVNGSELLNKEILQKFEDELVELLSKIYDSEKAFTQTEVLDNCQYCNFKSICNR